MIGPAQEGPRHGEGDFHDVVVAEFADPEADAFGLLRVARAPNQKQATIIAVLCSPGSSLTDIVCDEVAVDLPDWERVEVGPLRMTTERPLERWTAGLTTERCKLDLVLKARTSPIDFSHGEASDIAGVGRYEQLCDVTGPLEIDGSKRQLNCTGRRAHVWGAPDWSLISMRRSLYSGSQTGAVSIFGARPAGAQHDRDVIDCRLVRDGGAAEPTTDVMLSTVLDARSCPDSARIDLHAPDEEFASRLSGEAICKVSLEAGGREHRISFFRWTLDGKPGWGSYQTVSRA
ncbi:MAG: hypothetical protein WDZ37_03045 [Solirubrobacterales bacterium]